MNKDTVKINNFTLSSSSEVAEVMNKIELALEDQILIHIVSYIHNTVLVQSLLRELKKVAPEAKVVLLKHEDKQKTSLVLFSIKTDGVEHISDEILKELYVDHTTKQSSIEEYRTELFERYFTDQLTNLPNLYQLRKDLEDCDECGLILLKIDNFQTINNFYGFVVGDYVLEYVGKYLKESLPSHQVYRLSGAEYAITTVGKLGFYNLKAYLSALSERLKNLEITYMDNQIFVDFTLASSSDSINNSIFSKVSMALAYAKKKGIAYWIYEDKMNFKDEYQRNLQLSSIVREAVKNDKVIPYFQAIIDNKTNKISKYECLARLMDEKGRILSPMLFIPVAKNIKIYNQVTKAIMNKSFEVFEQNEFEFSINLSIEDIMSSEIFDFILEKLKNSHAATRVTFELLESEAIKDFKKVNRFISEITRHGAKIAIDDFGSGYSNFAYITKVNTDYIKIDGSLIENIDVDKASEIVVDTIVQFAKKLGIKTIAEYVHSSVIMEKVTELGIDYSQGFYIDKPSLELII